MQLSEGCDHYKIHCFKEGKPCQPTSLLEEESQKLVASNANESFCYLFFSVTFEEETEYSPVLIAEEEERDSVSDKSDNNFSP